jgi:NAD(P)-dependent dehydrogenase (short-subunit alcohol dehydrogenase family)
MVRDSVGNVRNSEVSAQGRGAGERDLEGRQFLLTGATEGLGKAAALEFAGRGAAIAFTARNPEKGARVAAELRAAAGPDRIELLTGDLSRLADVRRVAAEFRAKHDRLDVLVNNAGGVFTGRQASPDGFELTFALNHLAYFLLTTELIDLLRRTPGARVVSTASGAHMIGRLDLDAVAKKDSRRAGFRAYGDSKLANILFTGELARRLAGSGATANCFHPGWVATGFGLNNGGPAGLFIKYIAPVLARTPRKGAETLVWLATSPEAAKFSGEYFHDRRPASRSKLAKDDDLSRRLWELSEKLCAQA